MTYDSRVPTQLKQTQQWFASIITRPIDENSRINPIGPSGRSMEQEACDYIAPSPTLNSLQRIQIYNQQYWWRLLTVMHDNFPTVTRLFGYHDFNQMIGVPYLVKYPSDHWSLSNLGNYLTKWIEEEYTAGDKNLVLDAARVDWAYNDSFTAPQEQGIDLSNAASPDDFAILLETKLFLQPYVYLFELPYDLFQFRTEFLKKEPEYWIENDFPSLQHQESGKKLYFLLYRNRQNSIVVDTIGQSEFLVLQRFQTGTSIEAICQWMEELPSDNNLVEEASQQLQTWFQRWVANNLLKKI